jgi:hypothetical protein
MSEEFDPYKVWLDIENKTASTTYYKLLGLPEFESDKDRITAAADKAIRKIRSQKPGEHLSEWQKIIDELQEIKALLLDNHKKDAYDEDLRFADEFVRELEGGIKRDPAAAAVAAASASPKKTESRPVKQDPRYPPGMAPKSNSPPPPTKTAPDEIELKVSPGPKPIDRKDSPFYPPSRPAVDKAKPPAPEATPAPPSVTPSPSLANDMLPPGASSVPLDAAPSAPAYAPQPAPQPQPGGYPQSPYPGSYPQQQPAYPQQTYPQPTAYPQNYYPPPGGPSPMAGYPGQPMAYPMQQPGYGYGPTMAQPMGYGVPAMPGPYGGGPPMAAPMYGAPMAVPISPQGYISSPPTPAALDPMAPVAIPGTAMGGGPSPAPMAMPYGASAPTSVMMQPPSAAIPVGTAVAAVGGSSPGAPSNTGTASASDAPANEIRGKSAAAVIMAAKKEKSSQQTLLFVGVGGLLLVIVAVVVFVAASGQFGNRAVATNPPGNGGANVPAVAPDKTPPITVPPVNPPKKPEPEKPAPSKPTEPDKTKVPETKPKPEMPVETKPPETKPQPKPEPPKPEPPKPEPPKPEPPKPEPPKPEPKPEVPQGEMPTKEEVVELAKVLKDAKAAIGEFNFAEADAELVKAEKLAKLPEHRSKLSRLKEVGGYVKQFHDRLVQSATGMEGGESFKVGSSTMVAMIEANQKQVVLRVAGQNRTYQYGDLPVGLAAALADMKLQGSDPVSRVVKGAYVAVHRSSTPDQLQMAKSWWEEATLGGADVSHLMPFLTDSYDLAKDFDKLKKSDSAAKPESKDDSEKGTPKPGAKRVPDAKAILEGKTP